MYDKELRDISLNANGDKKQAREDMETFLADKGLDKPNRIEVILNFILNDEPAEVKEDQIEHNLNVLDKLHHENATVHTKLARIAAKIQPEGIEQVIEQELKKLEQGKLLLKLAEVAMTDNKMVFGMVLGHEKK